MFSDLEPRKIGVLEPPIEPDEGPEIEAAEFCLNCCSRLRCLSFRRALKGSGLLNRRPEMIDGVFSGSCSVFSLIPMVCMVGADIGPISDELTTIGMAEDDALVGLMADEAKMLEAAEAAELLT